MTLHLCLRCGSDLRPKGEGFDCPYCGAYYESEDESRYSQRLSAIMDEERARRLSDARRALYRAGKEKNPFSQQIALAAHDVFLLDPDDDMAVFYSAAVSEDPSSLAEYLNNASVPAALASDVVDFSIASLHESTVLPLKSFLLRHFHGDGLRAYQQRLEDEAGKVIEGVYEPGLPRDVFLCYSSADAVKAEEVVRLFEENSLTVFIASRNLRHGKGAVEHYNQALEQAMDACKVLVFLSSASSRSLSCDAMRLELPYIAKNRPNMPRVEYLLDDEESYAKTPFLAKKMLKEFFDGLEWCRDRDDLVQRVYEYAQSAPTLAPAAPKQEIEDYPQWREEEWSRDGDAVTYYSGGDYVVVPQGVRVIRANCFARNGGYFMVRQNITFPPSLRIIEPGAFQPADMETTIKWDTPSLHCHYYGTLESWLALEGKRNIPFSHIHLHFAPQGETHEIVLPSSVTALSDFAFCGCRSLTKLFLPDSLKQIGRCAFTNLSALEELDTPRVFFGKHFDMMCPLGQRLRRLRVRGGVIPEYYFRDIDLPTLEIVLDQGVEAVGPSAFARTKCIVRVLKKRFMLRRPKGFDQLWDEKFYGKVLYK